ncbi:hypothetical protein GWK08_18405 [Leptobacterium flavescens]|uniref:HTH luxR-type domain-containing protein n=1 Tax=Leptobacterium flavescens TaxID=472055 RepID=A0A6P0USB5_9FLAO|nr:hypothetical protein [Leptobacterium flavescens]NER15432.1 hypothetical protein [Leptobacterium flavescens]
MLNTIEYTVTAIVCLITAFVIQRIYFKEKKRNATAESVKGIKWFGLAIFSWGAGALLNFILVALNGVAADHKFIIYFGVLISLLNSLFILLSIPSIEHSRKRHIVIRIIERFSEREVFLIFGSILMMIAFVFVAVSYVNETANNSYIWLIDIPISLVVAYVLLQELNKAFSNRKMRFMYLPSFGLFLLIVIAVTHRIVPQEEIEGFLDVGIWNLIGVITAVSFKFLFILLFSILLYSWKFLSEKEQQQGELERLGKENLELAASRENNQLTIESHLDTIKSLKKKLSDSEKEVENLRESSKIEFSDRQKEVLGNLGLCGMQKSYTEIAEEMHISVDGLQAHIHQIKKLLSISGAGGKEQLIAYAKNNDLLRFASIHCEDK